MMDRNPEQTVPRPTQGQPTVFNQWKSIIGMEVNNVGHHFMMSMLF